MSNGLRRRNKNDTQKLGLCGLKKETKKKKSSIRELSKKPQLNLGNQIQTRRSGHHLWGKGKYQGKCFNNLFLPPQDAPSKKS
jgi:hypothetical protein